MRKKYVKCRVKFWREIGRRKSKSENIFIDENILKEHFMDLFATEVSAPENEEFDREIRTALIKESLSDVLSIVFELFILQQLEKTLKLDPKQYGFRKNASTSHAFWAYEEARRQLICEKKMRYVIFIDFQKHLTRSTDQKC